MIIFPNCKINLGLRILRKRPDGYHDIETVFHPVKWHDCMEIIPAETFGITISGRAIDGNPEDNLVVKAYNLLRKEFDLPPVQIYLRKNIPMGAGLGGGSADGAFMLKLLNNHFNLQLSYDSLESKAKNLGSDCPFFIRNRPVLATGTGTEFSPIKLNFQNHKIAIVYPGIHVNTAKAYAGLQLSGEGIGLSEILTQSPNTWKDILFNDFEESVSSQQPDISEIKKQFYDSGAVYSSMSGSGSAVFGLFEENTLPANWTNSFNFPAENLFSGSL